MSLFRIPFLLSGTMAWHASSLPPNPPPDKMETVKVTGVEYVLAKAIPWGPPLFNVFSWTLTFIEVAAILAGVTASSSPRSAQILSILVINNNRSASSAASNIRITPVFLVGWLLIVTGGLIRVACYRTMGNLFTFELSMRKDHRLITSGPYSVVRHPSYTGLIMAILGYWLCHLTSGSWIRECSALLINGTVGVVERVVISIWIIIYIGLTLVILARTDKEDAMLRKEFKEWDQWAGKVPWKLIPFVY